MFNDSHTQQMTDFHPFVDGFPPPRFTYFSAVNSAEIFI